nr:reverse transcriptase domain-containing protein [Tanacetum cinerariifolium]
QRFNESFSKAWDHFNDLLRACPHHGFSELHQLDTFYNALNINDQDSLNSAADVAELKDMVRALLLDQKNQYSAQTSSPTPAPIKAVEPNCVTCGGNHAYQNCPETSENVYQDNIQAYVSQAAAANYGQRNTSFRPQMVANQIRPPGFLPVQNTQYNFNRGNNFNQNRGMDECLALADLGVSINLMPLSVWKGLLLLELTPTCMTLELADRTESKPADPEKFLILCEFLGMDECLALADLGVSINLMPLSVWKGLLLLELTPTCMTLELADRTESKPAGIAKDVKTNRALFDVHKGELTLRIGNKAITYNLDQTSRYSANYDQMTANKIDVTDEACEEYSQEVLGFSDVTASGSPTASDDPIVSTTSHMLTVSRKISEVLVIKSNKIDITDEACEEYSQEVLGFSDVTASGSPTASDDPIVSTTSHMLTVSRKISEVL